MPDPLKPGHLKLVSTNENGRQPVLNLPPAVKALCLLNAGVFLFGYFFPQALTEDLLYALALVPARYTGLIPADVYAFISPVTHMFLHAGWLHIAVNLGALMAFGTGLEKALGGRAFLLLYFASGLGAALLHVALYSSSAAPAVGASGAISGLFGGVIVLMQGARDGASSWRALLPVVLIWIAVSVFFGLVGMPGVDDPVAWDMHVGGFICGLLLYRPLRRLGARL
jgi:membrane associated rhomboid family serine protease